MIKTILNWAEERTGVGSLVSHFLNEDIPASSGWKHVLGSVALFCFMVQATTGLLLALNYAPTVGEAYSSLKYILTELTGGPIIRSMHHWGASMMIVVVGFHMMQVFVWGAYKKPREATWLAGVVLLLLTLGYGLTGYLLPWDNRAYWGTVVTVQIAGLMPGAGPYVQRLLGSEGGAIGAVTFSRFYAAHVLVLPPITALMIAFHLYLVRRHGVAPQPEETATKKFYPSQVYKDTVAMFVAFAILLTMSIVASVPLGRMADPTDTTYTPRPEWYFLFLFQMLKLFEGPLELLGTLVLPNLAIVALFAVPFIDRGKAVQVGKRGMAVAVLALAGIAWGSLTFFAVKSTPVDNEFAKALDRPTEPWQLLPADELAAVGYFKSANCTKCHDARKATKDEEWLLEHFKTNAAVSLRDGQWKALGKMLGKLSDAHKEVMDPGAGTPAWALAGAAVYQMNQCAACHQLKGAGNKIGPAIDGLAFRRDKPWVVEHFQDPQKLSPGTSMPPYKQLKPDDLENLTHYIMMVPR
jgi:ubiquinol-cytochrome c reductase cytochrome b subunit